MRRRISPSHDYDSISSSTTEHDKEREKKKKDNNETTTNQDNEDTYTITFKKSPETAQEKIIKSIIERIAELRKTTDSTKTLTEDQFKALNKSIFEPMYEMHNELRQKEAKQTQTSEESSSDLEAQLIERLDKIRQTQPETSQIVIRSKSKEDVTKRNNEKDKDKKDNKDNKDNGDKSSDDNPDNWS